MFVSDFVFQNKPVNEKRIPFDIRFLKFIL